MKKSQLKKLIGTIVKEAMSSPNPCQVSCTQGFSPNPANNCACERTSSFRMGSMCVCPDGTKRQSCKDCPTPTFKDINPLDADGNPRPMPKRESMLNEKETACQKAAQIGINDCYDDHIDIDGNLGPGHSACHQGVIATFKACKSGGSMGMPGLDSQPLSKGSRYSPNNDGEFDPNDPDGQQRMRKGGPFEKPFDVDDLAQGMMASMCPCEDGSFAVVCSDCPENTQDIQRETLLLEKPTCAETAQVGFAACDDGDPDDYSGCVQGVFSSYSACKKAAGQSGSFGSNDVKHSLQRNSNPCREGETCATNPACCDGLSQPTRMGEQKSPKHKCCEDAQGNITNASSYPSKKCPKSQTPTACESAKPGGETKDTKKDTMSESFTSKMQRLANISKK